MSNVDLPPEIIEEIGRYLPRSSVRVCLQINKAWQHALTPRLYSAPYIAKTDSYHLFTETILGNPALGLDVRHLNLSRVIGTASTTRLPDLLTQLPHLRTFKVPQAAITVPLMTALSTLIELRVLDLEDANDRFELGRLVNLLSGAARHLHTLLYPRCAVSTRYPIKQYPPLTTFALRGGLRDDFLRVMTSESHPTLAIQHVLVSHAPSLTCPPVLNLLATWSTLRTLTVSWPLPRFSHNDMDPVLLFAKQVTSLRMAIDYVSARFFETNSPALERLVLDYSGVGKRGLLTGDNLVDALENDLQFPNLRQFGMTQKAREQLFADKETFDDFQWAAKTRGIEIVNIEEDDNYI